MTQLMPKPDEFYCLYWDSNCEDPCGWLNFSNDDGRLYNMLSSGFRIELKPIFDNYHNLVRFQVIPIHQNEYLSEKEVIRQLKEYGATGEDKYRQYILERRQDHPSEEATNDSTDASSRGRS